MQGGGYGGERESPGLLRVAYCTEKSWNSADAGVLYGLKDGVTSSLSRCHCRKPVP